MEFNPDNDSYELTDQEAALFELPEGVKEWPNSAALTLLGHIQAFEGRNTNVDLTGVPFGQREQVRFSIQHRANLARVARQLVINNMKIEASVEELDRLLSGE